MKYSIFILGFIVLFTAAETYAQDDKITRDDLTAFTNNGQNGVVRTRSVTKYKGTPYFNEWSKGYVKLNTKTSSEPIMLRFDMETNVIIFLRNDNIYAIPSNKLDGFVIYTNDGNINFRNGFETNEGDINRSTLLRIIYDGNVKLVAHHRSSLKENLATYGSANKRSEFVNDIDFFLIATDNSFHEVKLKDKDILNVLDYEEKLKKYANENNLSFKEEFELRKILKFYDSLQI